MRAGALANGLEWPIVAFLGAVHALALILCVAFPSWQGLVVLVALYLITGLGVTVGYHRKITHQSFRSPQWVEYVLAVLGLLSGEGPPVFWAAIHRQHHKCSDQPDDPHSPMDGFWWSHWLWMLPKIRRRSLGALYSTYAPDLIRQPFYQFLERSYFYWHLGLALLLVAAGWRLGSWRLAMSWFAYGYCLRMLVVLHATWMVNSVSHCWGRRAYETGDRSRNNALVALVAHGEGWHNNHHHAQSAANHGHRWWEFDLSFAVIVLAAVITRPFRLVTDVRVYSPRAGRIRTLLKSRQSG